MGEREKPVMGVVVPANAPLSKESAKLLQAGIADAKAGRTTPAVLTSADDLGARVTALQQQLDAETATRRAADARVAEQAKVIRGLQQQNAELLGALGKLRSIVAEDPNTVAALAREVYNARLGAVYSDDVDRWTRDTANGRRKHARNEAIQSVMHTLRAIARIRSKEGSP